MEPVTECPDCLRQAITVDVDARTSSYSYVYPVNDEKVVKLVREPGALDYLRMCRAARGASPHLPVVTDIVTGAVQLFGYQFSAVRLEKVRSGGTAMEAYASDFAWRVREYDDGALTSVLLPATALKCCAQQWPKPRRSMSSCLLLMADAVVEHDWVADLANDDNWMIRERAGAVVRSGPVHSREFVADTPSD